METLTEKVGPLPVWAYGALVFGGLLVLSVVRKKQTSSAASNAATPQPVVQTQIQPILITQLPNPPRYMTNPTGSTSGNS